MAEQLGEYVSISKEGRVAEVVLDRGDGLNALSMQAMRELTEAAQTLGRDTSISAIVLSGVGVFSAGADLKDPARTETRKASLLERRELLKLGPDLCQAWADIEAITIAAVEGFCIGGAVALAVACDHRIAAGNSHFRLPEIPLGMNMSWRTNPRTVALIGPSRAKQFTLLGEKLPAETALDWGLVDQVTAPGKAVEAALGMAGKYAKLPPLGLRMTKQAIDVAAQPLGFATSFMDRDQFALAQMSEDHAEAVLAFLEKRDGKFTGD